MKQVRCLIEKELLEHKIIIRLPLFLTFFVAVLFVLLLNNINDFSFNFQINGIENWQPVINHHTFAGIIGSMVFFIAGVMSLLSFFTYSAKTLAKERKEGSLAFWHSMPVSDTKAITIKLVVALFLIPLFSSIFLVIVDIIIWLFARWIMPADMLVSSVISLAAIGEHWLLFSSTMIAMSLALLPIACVIFCVSQVTDHPLLVLFVGVSLIRFIGYLLFDSTLLGDWLNKVSNLPFNILNSEQPWHKLLDVGSITLLGLFIVSVMFFYISVKLRSGD